MKGIKVIDVGSNPEETQFGTCELCFSYGVASNGVGGRVTKIGNLIKDDWLDFDTFF
ncbi:TPA: hypothetical protein ACGPAL_000414 [Streptococcus suis]